MSKIPVAVLGATGTVGQRFIQLLDNHPWFEVTTLTGSDRSAGQVYGDACHWLMNTEMPAWARSMRVVPNVPVDYNVAVAFSALPTATAKEVEPVLAQAGVVVCSNASAYRQEPDVPILLPEANADHANLVAFQRQQRGWKGCIVTNPNCTSTGLTIALKALGNAFGLEKLFAVSMQAISGAGYPGVASYDILDNIIPYVGGAEEEKVEQEPRKMLGTFTGQAIQLADFVASAHTNRVPVADGHTVCASVALATPATPEEAMTVLREYRGPEASRGLPSSPDPVIAVRTGIDQPQPRFERGTGKGMSTVIGRVRADPLFTLKFVVFSHNTVRGAAGGAVYNAELLTRMGIIDKALF
ncbi:MAG: aspartate-semialdehyde dehydrogenase [Chloroflexota bacterium]